MKGNLPKVVDDDALNVSVSSPDGLSIVASSSVVIGVEAYPRGLACRFPCPMEFYQMAIPGGHTIKRLQGAEEEAAQSEFDGR